jgi:hypothetical protein
MARHPIGNVWRILAAGLFAMLAGACSAAQEPVIPTTRPTFTPSTVPSPTPTRVFNASATPTPAQDNGTPTPGPSPTSLVGDLPTESPFTPTPTQMLFPDTLKIDYFTTDTTTLSPGDSLTLFWSTKGVDKAIIYRLDPDGQRGQLWNVSRAGSLPVSTRPEDRDVVQFLLSIGEGGNQKEQTLAVPINCTEGWFFDPQPSGCASTPPVISTEVQQLFEHGLMIWVQSEARVYVLFNDSQQPAWAAYPDEFKDGDPESDPSLTPPQGLSQPIRGFGLVWRTRERVRSRLGWATGPEIAFDGTVQGDASVEGGTFYMRNKDANILALSANGESWNLITP